MSVWAIIVAAGRGTRAALGQNKIFFSWEGRTMLERSVGAFARSGLVDGAVVVLSKDDRQRAEALLAERIDGAFAVRFAVGGESRQESVYNGLRALPEDCGIVAVHDAARPFVTRQIIKATIDSAREHSSGVMTTGVVDTIKWQTPDGRVFTPDRRTLLAAQTPQTFSTGLLIEAHRRAAEERFEGTDDAMLFEHFYGDVRLISVEGAERNRKLTTPEDFENLTRGAIPDIRAGQGYDVHRLTEGRPLVLCGVTVPHAMGLDGHSDADVATHALMDALLGAMGEGGIRRLFPDSDPAYEGISSLKLLDEVMKRVHGAGYAVGNADVTIVAQRPKLAGYIPRMRQCLAEHLDIPEDRVNVKATTTERLGFEGEEKGISAQAVALLVRR